MLWRNGARESAGRRCLRSQRPKENSVLCFQKRVSSQAFAERRDKEPVCLVVARQQRPRAEQFGLQEGRSIGSG